MRSATPSTASPCPAAGGSPRRQPAGGVFEPAVSAVDRPPAGDQWALRQLPARQRGGGDLRDPSARDRRAECVALDPCAAGRAQSGTAGDRGVSRVRLPARHRHRACRPVGGAVPVVPGIRCAAGGPARGAPPTPTTDHLADTRPRKHANPQNQPEGGSPMMEPKLEVPAEVRDLAAKTIDQAERAFGMFFDAANKSMAGIPAIDLLAASKNMPNALSARDINEAMQIQSEFLRSQFTNAGEHMR